MKKDKKKWLRKLVFRVFAGVVAVLLLLFIPSVGLGQNNNFELIYEKFVGKRSEYQGIIEIWNIDSFEGGFVSKSKMLSKIASGFQNKNKGLYFMVRNISESECKNLLASGQKPDLFSCSYGVAEMLQNEVSNFNFETSVADNLKIAGRDEVGGQKAIAWCASIYCLMSTKERLEKAGKSGEFSLVDVALNSGYKIKTKKDEKMVWSLELGCGKYLLPQNALSAYYNNGGVSILETSINKQNIKQTGYSAYCNFVAGKSSILLGSLRDAFRLINREAMGKISGLVVEPLSKFSDLIQFVMKCDDGDAVKQKYVDEFVKYLTGDAGQQVVCDGGLISVLSNGENLKKEGVMKDIPPQNIASYEVFNVFLSKSQIEKLQQDLLIFQE